MVGKTIVVNKYSIETFFGREKGTLKYSISSVYRGLKSQVPIKTFFGTTAKETSNQAIKWIEMYGG
jgi:hypothetical protein